MFQTFQFLALLLLLFGLSKKEEGNCLLSPQILRANTGSQMFIVRKRLADAVRPNDLPTCPNVGSLFLVNSGPACVLFYAHEY